MEEFREILTRNTKKIRSESSDHSRLVTANLKIDFKQFTEMSETDVQILHNRAATRNLEECVDAYKRTRIEFLDACFLRLGVIRTLSTDQVQQMSRHEIDATVNVCRRASLVFVDVLLPDEKELCAKIFRGLKVDPFLESFQVHAAQFIEFTKAVCCLPPCTENLISMLSLHQSLTDHLPRVDDYLQPDVPAQASDILKKLAEDLRVILSEFPNKILQSSLSMKDPEAPNLPRYVMKDFMIPMVSSYNKSLSEVLTEWTPPKDCYDLAKSIDLNIVKTEGQTRTEVVSLYLAWIIVNLAYNFRGTSRNNLKGKFDQSLLYKFNMVNFGYIVEKIEGCPELKEMIESHFWGKLSERFHSAIKNYLESATSILSKHLKINFFGIVTKKALSENLLAFNKNFDSLHQCLGTIVLSDQELRKKYQTSMLGKLLQPYKSFCKELEKHDLVARYTAKQLETAIEGFFSDKPNGHVKW